MRKNRWIFASMLIVSCLPPGHPPTEKTDLEQDTSADSETVQDGYSELVVDAAVDTEAWTELNSVPTETDTAENGKDTPLDSNKSDVGDGKIDITKVDTEIVFTDAEIKEPKKDIPSDDGAGVASDDDAISPDEISVITNKDTDADDGEQIDIVQPDTIECPEGYYYDPAKGECVSFCGADKYYEKKIGKCLLYPCSGCDLNGQWELAVLDAESMTFSYYTLTIMQSVSYLKGQLIISSPPEVADCAGALESTDFTLSCSADEFTLVLTSETANSDEISGFYSYSYKDGKFKNGPCNLNKSN